MNQDIIQGKWESLKGDVKARWGKLTDDKLTEIAGNRDKLLGEIQTQYGLERDAAEKQLSDFEKLH